MVTSDLQPHNNSYNSDLKKKLYQSVCYIFYGSLCYIQAGKKSLEIPGAIIRNTANLRKPLQFDNTKIFMFTVLLIKY